MQRILGLCLALAASADQPKLRAAHANRHARRAQSFGYASGTNESFGYSSGGYSSSGYGTTGYGNGSSGYGSSGYGGICPEETCWPMTYTATGEIDWNAPYKAVCATWTAGCPCDATWEVQCEAWGYKACYPKKDGCPLQCSSDQIYCYSYTYTSSGEPDYTSMSETCGNLTTGCPCDAQYEDRCTNSWGDSWCTPKIWPCPLDCAADEMLCYSTVYDASGHPDWMTPGNQSCASMNGSCPCHPVHEEKCTDWWGSWCQPKVDGGCPITCAADQMYCYEMVYDSMGNLNYSAQGQESCHNVSEGCPCHPTWEKKCTWGGYTSCYPSSMDCPVDCGYNPVCYHHSGNTSCGTSTGCTVCEADEISCQDPWGFFECYHTTEYPNGCPEVCNATTQITCFEVGFDATGMMLSTQFCHTMANATDWYCPVLCKSDSSKKCTTSWGDYCVSLSDTCPQVCTAQEQNCWVTDYSATGEWLTGKDVCAAADGACPCGTNSELCTDSWGYSYCESTFYGCPITCNAQQKYCYPVSYTASGDWNSTQAVQETCVGINATCPCGANAVSCSWTDDWGYTEEYCMPEAWGCPVTCNAGEKVCYNTDYNASGYPEKYSETCVAEGTPCTCGTNSQSCLDPFYGESFCYPLVDYWTNSKISCPVYCKENEDYCYIPSYDAQGNWLSQQEYCVPSGGKCDCSRGQNTFECTWNDPFYGNWSECLPTGGYCPATCPAGQVACDMVEDYMPDGTSLGWFPPPVRCADSFDKCPCGKESERCPGFGGCIFKDEGCPVECKANEKKCYIVDYNANGDFISDREACVAETEDCPCGKNTAKCENSDFCLSAADAKVVCPCKASETECGVVDYDKSGVATDFKIQCVKAGQACPCGKNSVSCPDPNDALLKFCEPSFEHKRCPAPCTAEAILAGNSTCVQTNLDKKGRFKSETVSCLAPGQTCSPGEGMKACFSGARISASAQCVNMYSTTGNATGTRRLDRKLQKTALRSTCNAVVTLSSLKSDAATQAANVRVQMNSVLQLPGSLSTSISVKASGSGGTLIYSVDNKGVSGDVAPSQVCEQLKKMVKSSNPDLTKAVEPVGAVNGQAGVNIELSSTTMRSRTQAAKEQKAAQSGVTTTSTSAAGSGGTTAAGSGDSTTAAGSGDSTTAGGTTGAPGDGETTTEMQSGSIGQGNSGATAAMCGLAFLLSFMM